MAKVIGITGGIGSGKSTVCNVFRILGIPVFEADAVARQLMNYNSSIKNGIIELFGEAIYTSSGQLIRQKLAENIFSKKSLLEKVNNLVHPVVRKEFYTFVDQNEAMPYVIYEAAILFEGGFHENMSFSILVSAPEEQRIARVIKRSGLSKEMIQERMRNQWPEEKKRALADYCLENDNQHLILPEIIRLDKQFKRNGTIW